MRSTPVKATVSTAVEPDEIMPAGVGTVMHRVMSMPMMVMVLGTSRNIEIQTNVGSALIVRWHGLNGAPVRT